MIMMIMMMIVIIIVMMLCEQHYTELHTSYLAVYSWPVNNTKVNPNKDAILFNQARIS